LDNYITPGSEFNHMCEAKRNALPCEHWRDYGEAAEGGPGEVCKRTGRPCACAGDVSECEAEAQTA
jgi:hypothetical protein